MHFTNIIQHWGGGVLKSGGCVSYFDSLSLDFFNYV